MGSVRADPRGALDARYVKAGSAFPSDRVGVCLWHTDPCSTDRQPYANRVATYAHCVECKRTDDSLAFDTHITRNPSMAWTPIIALALCALTTNPADLNDDGCVNVQDRMILLGCWGPLSEPNCEAADLDGDGSVNAPDLAELLSYIGDGCEEPRRYGVNMPPLTGDGNTIWVWTDAMKQAMPWWTRNRRWSPDDPCGNVYDTQQLHQIPVDPDGWPTELPWPIDCQGQPTTDPNRMQVLAAAIYREMDGQYPMGEYAITWDGDGDVDIQGFGVVVVNQTSPNRINFAVNATSDAGLLLRITRSEPDNHVRNVRVWTPGNEDIEGFHPRLLELLNDVSIIRFMDWQETNSSVQVQWTDRARPTRYTQAGHDNGVALEHCIDLCNAVGADIWLCVPHAASADYIHAMSELVRNRLHDDLICYVEYSNEVWNGQFTQFHWLATNHPAELHVERYADISSEARAGWYFGWGEDVSRVKWVCAGQHLSPGVTRRQAENMHGAFDVISCAAYFNPDNGSGLDPRGWPLNYDASVSPEQVIADSINMIETRGAPALAAHAAIIADWESRTGHDIEFVCYEGGAHYELGGIPYPFRDAVEASHANPAMYEAYHKLLTEADAIGVDAIVFFNLMGRWNSGWGGWGHVQYMTDDFDAQPKWRAINQP